MNGYEATKEIRKIDNQKDTPIIALTAGTIVGEKEKCLQAGMNDYIPKPIEKENLTIQSLNKNIYAWGSMGEIIVEGGSITP